MLNYNSQNLDNTGSCGQVKERKGKEKELSFTRPDMILFDFFSENGHFQLRSMLGPHLVVVLKFTVFLHDMC